jgi:hypothetical protein
VDHRTSVDCWSKERECGRPAEVSEFGQDGGDRPVAVTRDDFEAVAGVWVFGFQGGFEPGGPAF